MKKILLHSVSERNNDLFINNVRDNYNQPYKFLKNQLIHDHYDLITSDQNNLDNVDYVFFFDSNSVEYYYGLKGFFKKIYGMISSKYYFRDLFKEIKIRNIKSILFLWEAEAVMPRNWNLSLHKKFDCILTWNDNYIDNKKYFKIHWPQTNEFAEISNIPFKDKKLLVNISMNKRSKHKNELYNERINTIQYFNNKHEHDFDLFGIGWNKKQSIFNKNLVFNTYRGSVENKWDVMPKYKFAICYENIQNISGLVTEKIFDCMRCNCVPIYWGANNIHDYVDKGAFIDRRNFKSNEDLAKFILNIKEEEYNLYLFNIKMYLMSDKFYKFSPQNFYYSIKAHLI